MALNKQKIAIPFAQGIDTKVDPKQRPIGTLEVLENAIFEEPGTLKKRNGYELVPTEVLGGSDLLTPKRLTTFKDELCLYSSRKFYSYSESVQKWSDKGTISNIFPQSKSIVRNTYEQSQIDSYHVNGLDIYAWKDGRGGIRVSIVDRATGNEVVSDTEISSSGESPKVEFIGNEAYFVYVEGQDIKFRRVNPLNPATIESAVTLVSADVNATDKIIDCVSTGGKIFVGYHAVSGNLKIFNFDLTGTPSAVQEVSGESPSECLNLSTDASSRILIAYSDGTDVKVIIRSFTLIADIVAPTSVETISNCTNVTIGTTDSSNYIIYYEISAASTQDHYVKKNTIDLASSVGTASVFMRSVGLASESFEYDDMLYVALLHSSTLQSTVFIANQDSKIVTKISPNLAGSLLSHGSLPKVSPIDSDTYLYASQIKGRNVSEENTFFSVLGVQSTELEFEKTEKFENVELGGNLHTSGGVLQMYDGKEIVEHSFHVFPENLSDGGTATTGGSLSDGNYQYSAVYSWTDNKGQEHRSAPSIPLEVTLSGGTATQTQDVTIPTLRLTEKSNVVIELYRTENNGTIFYKVTSTTSPEYNNKTVDSITFTDTVSDSSLISNETLYTTGGVLDNISAPAAYLISEFNNRVFLAGLEDDNKLQYSKIRFEGRPVEFNDTLTINVNSTGGPITALGSLDDKLVIFKETAIFFLSGDGPNNLGEQDNFIEPELISADVGCINPESVVLTPDGLMFKSKKGIYVLSRALQPIYIGAPVEDYNNLTIKSADLIADKNQVVFATIDGNALVYNYFVKKWTTFSNHRAKSATVLNNEYYYLRTDNDIFVQNEGYTDNGSHIKLKMVTSWMSFAGVQNFQRVYKALILGNYKSAHKLNIKVAYNFIEAFTQEKVVDVSDFITESIYGTTSATYGSETPYGGSGAQYQIRLDFKKQKCQSIKISIEDIQDSNYGEGVELSNLLVVVGAKRGEFKVDQSRTYGTS